MKINITLDYSIEIRNCELIEIIGMIKNLLPILFTDIFQNILVSFGEYSMSLKTKPFECERCRNNEHFIWKTRHGRPTRILTELMKLVIHQLQVECKECGHKFYITRKLLGLESRVRISHSTRLKLGLIGALTTFRVAEKMTKIFGWSVDKMTIWRSVKKTGEGIKFDIDENECGRGEADGTGIPINGISKRGKEMKVFIQHKKDGKVRIAGIGIGNYDKGWDKLFKPLIKKMNKFKTFLVTSQ